MPHRVALALCLILAEVLPAQTGTIAGTVTLSPTLTSRRPRFRIYKEPGRVTPTPAPATDAEEMKNVVIYLERVPGSATPRTPDAVIRQKDERFTPHVLAVTRGTSVAFPNDDPLFHNVFSLSRAKTFDLGRYGRGATKSVTFDKAGAVQIFCHIHSDMSAVVLVLDNAFFVSPSADGTFSLAGIPAGEYNVVGWHERVKPLTQVVRVTPGATTRADFNIPIQQPASGAPPPD